MQPLKRAAFTLEILSSWAILTLLISAVLLKITHQIDIPTFPMLADDITKITDIEVLQKLCVLLIDETAKRKDQTWLLVAWGFSMVAFWSSIFALAAIYLARLLRDSKRNAAEQHAVGVVEQAITGELPLWKAFWLLYMALPFLLALTTRGIVWCLKHYHVIETGLLADLLIVPLTQAAILTIWLWGATVTWRCATNTRRPVWKYTARTVVIIQTVLPLIVSVGMLSHVLWLR